MITVLVLDDDEAKSKQIGEVVLSILSSDDVAVEHVATVHEAATRLAASPDVDLLILDLHVPLRRGEGARPDGGLKLMEVIRARKKVRRPHHIIGLTAFDNLQQAQEGHFEKDLWHLVKFDPASTEWAERIGAKLVHIADLRSGREETSDSGFASDVAIVTALHQIELEAVLRLDARWRSITVPGDDAIYHEGWLETSVGKARVIATASEEMGMPAAAVTSMKLIEAFRPRYLFMTGIAAGVDRQCQFGDVLVADHVWDYGSGKVKYDERTGSNFLPAPSQMRLDPSLRAKVNLFAIAEKGALELIRNSWPEDTLAPLSVRVGPVASGASVVENAFLVEEIKRHNRKVIGIEMEAYGVHLAARSARRPRPTAMVAKSVCDFGSPGKSDAFQRYAAYTSARFIAELIKRYLFGAPDAGLGAPLVASKRGGRKGRRKPSTKRK